MGASSRAHWIDRWEPEDPGFWESTGKRIARRNLVFSIFAENIGFSIWVLWTIVVINLANAGIDLSLAEQFWLTAVPNLIGSALVMVDGQFATWDDGTVQFAWLASMTTFAGAIGVGGVMACAVGVAGRAARSMPRWLSAASVVVGAVLMLGAAVGVSNLDALESGQLLVLVLNLWTLVVAVAHLVRRSSAVAV